MKKIQAFLRPIIGKTLGVYLNLLVLFSPSRAARSAFFIFCKVRKGKVAKHQEPYLVAAKNKIETVANHAIQTYFWPGGGDTVLLVHGWESNTFRWRNLVYLLQEAGFSVLAFDAPAHGFSSGQYLHVPLYAECVEHLVKTYSPKHIIGHSMGGMTALYYAHRHPETILEKIVTIGSPSEFQDIMNDFRRILGFNRRVLRALDQFIFEEFGFHAHEFSSRRFVENRRQKGLLLHDKLDRIIPFHASEQVHKVWKDSVLIATEGLGHSLNKKSVNQQIVSFLQND
jgi:pimeloyl-ACP methyl ester carboxylesterase